MGNWRRQSTTSYFNCSTLSERTFHSFSFSIDRRRIRPQTVRLVCTVAGGHPPEIRRTGQKPSVFPSVLAASSLTGYATRRRERRTATGPDADEWSIPPASLFLLMEDWKKSGSIVLRRCRRLRRRRCCSCCREHLLLRQSKGDAADCSAATSIRRRPQCLTEF